jgi:hypothetical protein
MLRGLLNQLGVQFIEVDYPATLTNVDYPMLVERTMNEISAQGLKLLKTRNGSKNNAFIKSKITDLTQVLKTLEEAA